MSNFNNPENALKRANEFLELGKQDEAVDCLYDILKNKKNHILKNTHEAIINKLLDVCVDCRMPATVKDGLYLYRNICHSVDLKSWEEAIRRLICLIENKIETTTKELLIYDTTELCSLDRTITFEKILKLVNNSKSGIKSYIELFRWIKFNWECYRFCLDLLRNTQIEKLYHYVAQKALKFCMKYQRKIEFRKLCNVFKVHLGFKQKPQIYLSTLNNPEALALYLETGLLELEIAIKLELWQEVFKATENLHLMIGSIKRQGNTKIIANYYEKLAGVFLKTGDHLYHSAALFRYFLLTKELKKNVRTEEVSALSSAVVLSVIAVPFPPNNPTIDLLAENDVSVSEKKHRSLSSLLNYSSKLSRKTLVKDLERHEVISVTQTEIRELFNLLEKELDPLNMGNKIISLTKAFSQLSLLHHDSLSKYLDSVLDVFIVLLLTQLSKIYETMTWSKFISLVPISDTFYVERFVVEAARRYDIPVRLDHINSCLRFNTVLFFQSSNNEGGLEVRQLPEDKSMNYLSQVYSSLKMLGRYLEPNYFMTEENAVRKMVTEQYLRVSCDDHKGILQRKKIIEKHKEMVENLRLEREEQEKNLMTAKQLEFEAAERVRLVKEAEEKAHQKRIQQQAEMKRKILQEKIEILKKSEFGDIVEKLDINELEDLDSEVIFSKHFERITREKKGLASRLRKQDRTTDHMERAKRIVEVPLLIKKYEEDKAVNKSTWEIDENRRIETVLAERARSVREKERALVIKNDLKDFVKQIQERRKLEYIKESNDFHILLQSEREKRLKERALDRKVQRRLEWMEEKKKTEIIRKINQISITDNKNCKNTSTFKYVSPHNEEIGYSRETPLQKRSSYNKKNQTHKVVYKSVQKFISPTTSKSTFLVGDDSFSEHQTSKETTFEQDGSSATHEYLPKRQKGYQYTKYYNRSEKCDISPNKRYEDQIEESRKESKKSRDIHSDSQTKFSKKLGNFLSSAAADENNRDQNEPNRNYKKPNQKSLSSNSGASNCSTETSYRIPSENDRQNYSNSPIKFVKRFFYPTNHQTFNEDSIDQSLFKTSHETSINETRLTHKTMKREYTAGEDKTSSKYVVPWNKYSNSSVNYNDYRNIKYERPDKRDYSNFNPSNIVSNSEKRTTLNTCFNQNSSNFNNYKDTDFFSTQTSETNVKKENFARFKLECDRSSDTQLEAQHYKKGSVYTNKNVKYEVKNSCTPWAKLHRKDYVKE